MSPKTAVTFFTYQSFFKQVCSFLKSICCYRKVTTFVTSLFLTFLWCRFCYWSLVYHKVCL